MEAWLPLCGFNPDSAVFAMLAGYIDESYSGENEPETFGLCCAYAPFRDWFWIQSGWQKVIAAKNISLISQGRKPIQRFHSKEISNFEKDFANWTGDERSEFTGNLLSKGINGNFVQSYALTANLKQVADDWPRVKFEGVKRFGYDAMLRMIMIALEKRIPPVFGDGERIVLVNERCEFDGVLLDAFNHFRAQSPSKGKMFVSIAPMGWEDCTALQIADFCAYESMKEVHRYRPGQLKPDNTMRERRKSLTAFLNLESVGGICEEIPPQEILRWKALVEERDRQRGRSDLNDFSAV
jgi:hypothetical protein